MLNNARPNLIREKIRKLQQELRESNFSLTQDLSYEVQHENDLSRTPFLEEYKIKNDQADAFVKKIELEKRRIADLEKQIHVAKMASVSQKKKKGGFDAERRNKKVLNRQITALEKTLSNAILHFNTLTTKNKALRERIDEIRKERMVCDSIYRKFEKTALGSHDRIIELLKNCETAYRTHDEVCIEIELIRKEAEEERVQFETDFFELERLIAQDQRATRLEDLPNLKQPNGMLSIEDALIESIEVAEKSVNESNMSLKLEQDKSKSYEKCFTAIKQATGISSTDKILKHSDKTDKQVADIQKEIEALENQIKQVHEEVKELRNKAKDPQAMQHHQERYEALARELGVDESKMDPANAIAASRDLFQDISKQIVQLSIHLETKESESKTVSESEADRRYKVEHVMQCLEVVETHVNSLARSSA